MNKFFSSANDYFASRDARKEGKDGKLNGNN
jgi:hypothetical protein